MPRLIGERVFKWFGGIKAVSNATFEIGGGRITAIIGPNGAGKSTLLNLITGFLRPDSGRICYGETSLIGRSPHIIARLGVCRTFQDLRLIRGLTVLDNLLLAGADEHRAQECLDVVGLPNHEEAYAGALSYGQQKLLTLACCLAAGSDHLLLDEPVAGVHPDLVEQVEVVLKDLQRQGKTIVVIEHNLDFVKRVSDRVIVLAEGTIIAEGTASEVLSQKQVVDAYLQ